MSTILPKPADVRRTRRMVRLTPIRNPQSSLKNRIINWILSSLASTISWFYKLLFGWWLNGLLVRSAEKKLRMAVEKECPFLFEELGAKFTQLERGKWGNIITLEVRDLYFKVAWDRGEYFAYVMPAHTPDAWENVISVILSKSDIPSKPSYINLADLGILVKSQFANIQNALSKEHYPETVKKIDAIHELGMTDLANSFNKPDSYFHADLVNFPYKDKQS